MALGQNSSMLVWLVLRAALSIYALCNPTWNSTSTVDEERLLVMYSSKGDTRERGRLVPWVALAVLYSKTPRNRAFSFLVRDYFGRTVVLRGVVTIAEERVGSTSENQRSGIEPEVQQHHKIRNATCVPSQEVHTVPLGDPMRTRYYQ